jgi:TatD DNase family protein
LAKIELFDTHCHIHDRGYTLDPDQVITDGEKAGVNRAICVGTTLEDSKRAINFVANRFGLWSSIGLHPHEAESYVHKSALAKEFSSLIDRPKVVAVGECGLDYYYLHSSKKTQQELLRFQIELALKNYLPLIFHVREAFEDFWKIFDDYQNIQGVIHSFTSSKKHLDEALKRGLYIGLNGITTFTKNDELIDGVKLIPLDRIVLETDAPFLTPTPYRGTICQLMHVRVTAEFLSKARGESLEKLAAATTNNSLKLFGLEGAINNA